jgi:hypothetical protein
LNSYWRQATQTRPVLPTPTSQDWLPCTESDTFILFEKVRPPSVEREKKTPLFGPLAVNSAQQT